MWAIEGKVFGPKRKGDERCFIGWWRNLLFFHPSASVLMGHGMDPQGPSSLIKNVEIRSQSLERFAPHQRTRASIAPRLKSKCQFLVTLVIRSAFLLYDSRTKSQPILAPAIGSIGQRRRLGKGKAFSTTVARSSQQSPLPTSSRHSTSKKSLHETFPTRFGRRIGYPLVHFSDTH